MFYIDCYETKQGGIMDKIEASPEEILDVYRYGQKQGFVAGLIVCYVAHRLYRRRQKYQYAIAELRRDKIR